MVYITYLTMLAVLVSPGGTSIKSTANFLVITGFVWMFYTGFGRR